jgi:multidrug efflux pump subunit AcrA (membrane-fusion protein)
MPRSSIWSALIAVTAAGGLLAFILRSALGGPPSDPRPGDIEAARTELPAAAGRDDRVALPETRGVAGNGIIEPADRETKVAGQAPGRIATVHVKEGDQVEVGQLLLELEAATERASLAAAEADVTAAEAELSRTLHGRIRQDIDAARNG